MTYKEIVNYPIGYPCVEFDYLTPIKGYWITEADKQILKEQTDMVKFNDDNTYNGLLFVHTEIKPDYWIFDGKNWHLARIYNADDGLIEIINDEDVFDNGIKETDF